MNLCKAFAWTEYVDSGRTHYLPRHESDAKCIKLMQDESKIFDQFPADTRIVIVKLKPVIKGFELHYTRDGPCLFGVGPLPISTIKSVKTMTTPGQL